MYTGESAISKWHALSQTPSRTWADRDEYSFLSDNASITIKRHEKGVQSK